MRRVPWYPRPSSDLLPSRFVVVSISYPFSLSRDLASSHSHLPLPRFSPILSVQVLAIFEAYPIRKVCDSLVGTSGVDGEGDPDFSRPADTADAFLRAIVRDTRVEF